MDFEVLRRADGLLVLVPVLFEVPLAAGAGAARLGRVHLDLDALAPPTVAALGLHGYAPLAGPEIALARKALGQADRATAV